MPPPGDERSKHGEIAAWCGEPECVAARKGRIPAGMAARTGGRWKGLVNYQHEAGRRVALKDRASSGRLASPGVIDAAQGRGGDGCLGS